jgi:hypothetical protein
MLLKTGLREPMLYLGMFLKECYISVNLKVWFTRIYFVVVRPGRPDWAIFRPIERLFTLCSFLIKEVHVFSQTYLVTLCSTLYWFHKQN